MARLMRIPAAEPDLAFGLERSQLSLFIGREPTEIALLVFESALSR